MLILLPPSEGKAAPRRGKPLDLAALGSPALTPARERVLDALVELCDVHRDPSVPTQNALLLEQAAATLGLGVSQSDLVDLNARLRTAPTARADRIYTGVLYDALDFATLSPAAKRRANTRIGIASSLFGLVRPGDPIPSYRLSGDVALPGLGAVAGVWREALEPVMAEALGSGLLVDLRSGMYAAFWRPPADLATRVATVRVLHEHNGTRKVVSHFNKATKGRIVRAVLEHGGAPRTPDGFADLLVELGWDVEVHEPTKKGTQLDVVVSEL
ncbi:peroxide stress protein YaaA [Nocardioides jiangxiensis]|uniref:Peroxide stress protein YaaA n=1 Tax=Nocardioides jiangxiensis TaxID=3064524 RepID=A0ABT9AX74_9ACTN|nr:peroxide stress protein YaaA [Nocardioides sp. WY-20]MDO7867124.1 peroxide stress protein YaaA [Nocardioides sp. WY-20]